MYPSMNAKMQEGLANTYKESGFLPEWASPGHRGCMVGNNSASVVADAWLKRSAWLRHRDIVECCEERYGECASRGFLYRTLGT